MDPDVARHFDVIGLVHTSGAYIHKSISRSVKLCFYSYKTVLNMLCVR